MADGARERREAIRQLADLRRRLEAAEGTLTDALAASKRAEEAFDAASDQFDTAEHALDEAREQRAQARRDRYAARQAYERASATADRLARRVREASERLDRSAELAATPQPCPDALVNGDWPPVDPGAQPKDDQTERCENGPEWGRAGQAGGD